MESLKRLLWWMLAGSSGGLNRGRIITLLRGRPFNAHQIAKELGLDYKTVRHHLDVLLENQLLTARGAGYGRMFFLSPMLETNFPVFDEIWGEIGKTQIRQESDAKPEGAKKEGTDVEGDVK
jgi:DNA-binding transcriptional ArsR family regulator